MKRKIIYLISLLAVLGLNIFYVEYSVFLLFILFVGVPVLSWITLQIAAFGLHVQTAIGVSQQQIKVQVKTAFKSIFTATRGKITGRYEESFCTEKGKIQWDLQENTCEILPLHTGLVKVYIDRVQLLDALQIFSRRKKVRKVYKVFCYPERIGVKQMYTQTEPVSEENAMYSMSQKGQADTEIAQIRAYQKGDMIHRIHWKLSATKDEYYVKEPEYITDHPHYIFVDLQCDGTYDSRCALDRIYQAVDTIGSFYVSRNEGATFVIWNPVRETVEELMFDSDETLIESVKGIMEIQVCNQSGLMAYDIYSKLYQQMGYRPVYVTANKNIPDACIGLNVQEMKLEELLEYLNQLYQ